MELPQNNEEQKLYEKIILEDREGYGTIYVGNYYNLKYQPCRVSEYNLKCIGVTLFACRQSDKYARDFDIISIPFKSQKCNFISRFILGNKSAKKYELPFKDRLKIEIDTFITEIKERELHILELEKSAEKIKICQCKIDKTMSEFRVCDHES